jgi:hypothetical protein
MDECEPPPYFPGGELDQLRKAARASLKFVDLYRGLMPVISEALASDAEENEEEAEVVDDFERVLRKALGEENRSDDTE